MFTAGGTLLKCNLTLRSSETIKILRFLITKIANKAMSAGYDGNEILVSALRWPTGVTAKLSFSFRYKPVLLIRNNTKSSYNTT